VRAWFALFLASSSAAAIDVQTGSEDFTLRVEPLLQPRIQVNWDGAPGAAAPSGHANTDFFIQRARLLARGTAYKHFLFGVNIVAVRIGERGNLNVTPFLQDLVVGYVPATDVSVETGLLVMPLSHAALEGAVYGSTIEGVGNVLLYNNARLLREVGIQMRALLLGRRLVLRGGF
jgi:hypothetical protein